MPGDPFATERPLTVVVNPVAGGGRARRRAEALERELRKAQVPFDVRETAARGDARRFAGEAGRSAVVAVGGDGTVHEVLDGLRPQGDVLGPLAVLPAGSGDDFAAATGFDRRPDRLVARLREGTERRIDCGVATLIRSDGSEHRERFVDDVGIGFVADVVQAIRGVPLRGKLLYLTATLRALARLRPIEAEFALDGGARATRRCLLVSLCNVPAIGGGLPFAPDARLDDGRLDLVEIAATSRLGTLSLLGKLLRRRHRDDARVRCTTFQEARLRFPLPAPISMDGELIATDATALHVATLPRALRLVGCRAPT